MNDDSIVTLDEPIATLKVSYDDVDCSKLFTGSIVSDSISANDIFSSIPIEKAEEYRTINSEESYWKNKMNDLLDVIRILTAYNIDDIDCNELILRAREAAKYRTAAADKATEFEKEYPGIENTLNYVFSSDVNTHDPIFERKWKTWEKSKYLNSPIPPEYFKKLQGSCVVNTSPANSMFRIK